MSKEEKMSQAYDNYYQTEHLFGEPYPELIEFYRSIQPKGKLLDLGCGQGRDSLMLAKLGYDVTGIDSSKVGIAQLNKSARKEKLSVKGVVGNIYAYPHFEEYDFILLDSMFHFGQKEREEEVNLLERIFGRAKPDTLITICLQNTGNKIKILNAIIAKNQNLQVVDRTDLIYRFEDRTSNHSSETKYQMLSIKKKSIWME